MNRCFSTWGDLFGVILVEFCLYIASPGDNTRDRKVDCSDPTCL